MTKAKGPNENREEKRKTMTTLLPDTISPLSLVEEIDKRTTDWFFPPLLALRLPIHQIAHDKRKNKR